MITELILQTFFIFIATIGFSVIFNVNKSELIFCGLVGAVCYALYFYFFKFLHQEFLGVIIGTLVSTYFSRVLTYFRKMPVTLYVIPSIIPLVPGGSIYSSIFNIINGNYGMAFTSGLDAIKIAGAIVIGMSISLTLPKFFFLKPRNL